jgi:hypothetical protein
MNPTNWIRWKLLTAIVVAACVLALFGVDPLAKASFNRLGAANLGLRWNAKDLDFGPLAGRLTINGLEVAIASTASAVADPGALRVKDSTAPDSGQVFTAQSLVLDLDMAQLMRRRYCGELLVKAPKLRLERRADGSMNIDFGSEPDRTELEETDWWGGAQKLMQRIQQWSEQHRDLVDTIQRDKVEQNTEEIAAREQSRFRVDYSQRVVYPFQHRARIVATRLVGEELEIAFVDNTPSGLTRGSIPPLENGSILIENLSDMPTTYPQPIRWTIAGNMAGAPIKLIGTLDQRLANPYERSSHRSKLEFDFHADGLPVDVVQFFARESLPLQFDSGTITLTASATILDWNRLDVRPVLAFRNAAVSPRPGVRAIAGVKPDMFCRAFNEIGTLEISDIRVTGTVLKPNVDLGQTVTSLVKNSGKAIAKKQIDRGVQKGSEKLGQVIDKELGKLDGDAELPPEIGKTADALKKGLGDRLKGMPIGEKAKRGTTKK